MNTIILGYCIIRFVSPEKTHNIIFDIAIPISLLIQDSNQRDIQSYFALKNLNLSCPPSTITGFCCIKWNKSFQKSWELFAVSSITCLAVGMQTAKRMKGTEVINRNLNTGMNRFKPLKSSVAQKDLICATWGTCIWNT